MKTFILGLFLALASLAAPGMAQQFSFSGGSGRPLDPEQAFALELHEVRDGRARIRWQIARGYYLYRDQIRASRDGRPLTVETPPGVIHDDPNFGTVEVFYDDATATLTGTGGKVALTWQGCQEDGICYAPVTRILDLPPLAGDAAPDAAKTGMRLAGDGGLVAGLAGRGGAALVLAAFFGFGLALVFTPCVFPMVPILAGMLARQGERLTPARGAVLSGAYVLSMAAAFAALGAAAGWSGQNLQMLLQAPFAVAMVAALFVLLALSSFGLFDLKLPARLTARLTGRGGARGSVAGAAALGFTSALIVGPCVTAPLAGAFLYIAQTGDVALGAAALFLLGLGQGVPLFLAGTFGSRILPRAGIWMEQMRRVFGLVFLAMAVWLGGRLLPGPAVLALWAVLLAGAAVFFGALDRLEHDAAAGQRLGRGAGVIALFIAALLGLGAAMGASDPLRPLAPLTSRADGPRSEAPDFAAITDPDSLRAALAAGPAQPSMIYVTADWCTTCKGIERRVLPDPQVVRALQGMRLLEADVTRLDGGGQALLDRLGAAGPPTMVFLDAAATEPPGSRLIGSIGAADIARAAALVRGDG